MATLIVGLIIRISVTYLAVMGSSFSKIENLFCAIAWLPKATVQVSGFHLDCIKCKQMIILPSFLKMALFDIYMLVHLKRVDYLTLTSGSKKLIEEDQLIV